MKPSVLRTLPCLTLCAIALFSCQKDKSKPGSGTTPPPVTGTMTFTTPIDSSYEVIVSETGGKVLYDSLFMAQTTVSITIHTNDALVDLTTVNQVKNIGYYNIVFNKGVNPSTWKSIFQGYYNVPYTAPAASHNSKITYINVPSFADFGIGATTMFDNFLYGLSSGGGAYGTYPLPFCTFNFTQFDNHPDYLLLQAAGLYNFHTPITTNDTVDLSHMDPAVELNFKRPAQYNNMTSCSLTGYRDTTDFSNSTSLYYYMSYQTNKPPVDLEYPQVSMQKYELSVTLNTSSNDVGYYYSYGDSIPSTLPLFDESFFQLSATQNDNFSVNFVSAKPSYYSVTLTGGTQAAPIYFGMTASPDSTTLHPLSMLTSLNSQVLKGLDLSTLALSNFQFEKAAGLDYPGYFNYLHNPDALKANRLSSSIQFTKNF